MTMLKTKRLILCPWKEANLKSFAELNADPRVMEYFPSVLSQKQSDNLAKRIIAKFDHPKLPEGHSLRKQVLYRINQQQWQFNVPQEDL